MKTKEELIKIHKELHQSLDKLIACYIDTTSIQKNLSNTSVMELMEWSFEQTKNPSCFKEEVVSPLPSINSKLNKMKYRILFDYGGYDGCKFQDEEFDTVGEAVKHAIELNYATKFYIVQIIDWEAKSVVSPNQ